MDLTSTELAAALGADHVGPACRVAGLAGLDRAGPQHLSFADKEVRGAAGVVLCRAPVEGRTCIVVAEPKRAMVEVIERFWPEVLDGPPAIVHPNARVLEGALVGHSCEIGEGSVIFPGAVLYPGTLVGARCRVHANAVLGADGFAFLPSPNGPIKVPHRGRVVLEDEVEVGPGCTIDRAFLDETRLGRGSKLDAQVHIGHNCRVGPFTVIAAQTGVSGSVTIGAGVMIGGQVGIVDHVTIGDGARIGAGSGVTRDVPAGETWLGSPAMPIAQTRRIWAAWRWLPELVRKR